MPCSNRLFASRSPCKEIIGRQRQTVLPFHGAGAQSFLDPICIQQQGTQGNPKGGGGYEHQAEIDAKRSLPLDRFVAIVRLGVSCHAVCRTSWQCIRLRSNTNQSFIMTVLQKALGPESCCFAAVRDLGRFAYRNRSYLTVSHNCARNTEIQQA